MSLDLDACFPRRVIAVRADPSALMDLGEPIRILLKVRFVFWVLVSVSVCLSVCLSAGLPGCLSVFLFVRK